MHMYPGKTMKCKWLKTEKRPKYINRFPLQAGNKTALKTKI